MFNLFRKPGVGVLPFDELLRRSERYMRAFLADREKRENCLELHAMYHDSEWYEAWILYYRQSVLPKIAKARTLVAQVLALRRETLTLIEASRAVEPFVLKDPPDHEKRLLAAVLHPGKDFVEVQQFSLETYIGSEASIRCLRLLSRDLGDARDNDWYVMYCELFDQFMKHARNGTMAEARGGVYAHYREAAEAKMLVDKAKEKVLDGYNWDWK